jgi:predicted naringenin-chalcone synthase
MEMYDLFAAPLAIRAAREALRDADVDGSAVKHVVTVSCSGFSSPGVDLAMIRELALRSDVSRTHIGFMGCHGALNGLRVAKAFAQSSRGCVLLCAVELCTLHHQYGWQPEQIVANSLFADGAATVVVRAGKSCSERELRVTDLRSTVIPETSDLMRWRIDDHGFQMNLSPRVPAVIKSALRPWLQSWLGEHGLRIDNIGSWAIHPGGPRIVEGCVEALAIDSDCASDSLGILAEYGNMSSPTVLFILDRLRRRKAPRPYLALAFGPGIAVEAALLS